MIDFWRRVFNTTFTLGQSSGLKVKNSLIIKIIKIQRFRCLTFGIDRCRALESWYGPAPDRPGPCLDRPGARPVQAS